MKSGNVPEFMGAWNELSGTRTHDLRIKSPLLYRLSYELEEEGH
jgi:hypothetical protein